MTGIPEETDPTPLREPFPEGLQIIKYMKLKHTAALTTAFAIATTICASASAVMVPVTISGGNGSPLSVTFTQDTVFTNVTTGLTSYGFALIGVAPGNSIEESQTHSGTAIWPDGDTSSIGGFMGTLTSSSLSLQDLFVLSFGQSLSTSTMTLKAGSQMTSASLSPTFTQGAGQYQIRMLDIELEVMGDRGVAVVPEPTTALLTALSSLCLLRRKRS